MKTPDQIQEEQSQRIFWVIQTIFSLLLVQSFLDYKNCFLNPFSKQYYLTTIGLFLVYGTVLWSWIDYSYTTIVSPYRFSRGNLERLRFIIDLLVVISYAYLLFSLEDLQIDKTANLFRLFLFLFIVFLLYLGSGFLRIIEYGRRASRIWVITLFATAYLVLTIFYSVLYERINQKEKQNIVFMLIAIFVMACYRIVRSKIASRSKWVAVDIDGVLANQIDGILSKIKKRYNIDLLYDDVKEWDLKIEETDMAQMIWDELKNRKYVLSMPLHRGALEAMNKLISHHKIVIVTARPPESDIWTKQWLSKNKVPFDTYVNMKEGNKHNIDVEVSVLVDDYIMNIQGFLENSDGKAILFSQPWNQNLDHLKYYIDQGRLKVVKNWSCVPCSVKKLA